MAIIDKILNRKSEKNPREQLQRRLTQIASLPQTELEAIATSEEDATIRCEAIMHLNYGQALIAAAFPAQTSSLSRNARQRLADLIENRRVSVNEASAALTLEQRLAVGALIVNDDLIEQLLADIADQQQLLNLAKTQQSARIREWVADKITDPQAQQALLQFSKGKDKTVYKLMKSRLDAQQDELNQQQALRNKIAELMVAIERHSKSPIDHLFQAKRDHLKQQWRQLSDQAQRDDNARVEAWFSDCEQPIAAVQPQQPEAVREETPKPVPDAQAETHRVISPIEADKIAQQRQELLASANKVLLNLFEHPEAMERSHTELNNTHIDERWKDLERQLPASAEEGSQFQSLRKSIARELNDIDTFGVLNLHLASLITKPIETESHALALQEKSISKFRARIKTARELDSSATFITEIDEKFNAWKQQRTQELEKQQGMLRQITSLIRKSQGALKAGKTAQAQGIRSTLEDKCSRVNKLPRHLQKQLQELDEQLNKVQDWKEYAVQPKKHSLLEQMQALIGANEPPEALATKIKRLQDEWKLLSKGGFGDDGDVWEQFKAAGDKAFEPCAEYFSHQSKLRHDNLHKRENLVAQLREYNDNQDWENPDWKQVAKLVQMAFTEWHSYQPVERAANRSIQKEFEQIVDALRDRLNHEYQGNKEQKKALVEQAAKLVEMEDNRAAIDQVKVLQSRWKNIGSASHKIDQNLWKHFRKHCDQVFDKRKQLNVEFKAELNENKNKALILSEEVEKLSQQGLSELLASRERVDEIRKIFAEIGSLPKEKAGEIQKHFRSVVGNFDKKIIQEQIKAKAGAWNALLETYQLAYEYCVAVGRGVDAADLKGNLNDAMQNSTHWPKGGVTALQQLLEKTQSQTNEIDQYQRRLLCIRAEILAGLESPTEDNNLRMEYQVKQLTKGFGQAQRQFQNAKEAMHALLMEWIETLPIAGENYSALLARMNQCRQKIGV
jgi:hypothetical protein